MKRNFVRRATLVLGLLASAPPVTAQQQPDWQRVRALAPDAELAVTLSQGAPPIRCRFPSWTDVQEMIQYEHDRRVIDDEYEHILRTEIPGSYLAAVLVPGMKTGGFEDEANAIRRAMLDFDPTSIIKTLTAQVARMEEQLTVWSVHAGSPRQDFSRALYSVDYS